MKVKITTERVVDFEKHLDCKNYIEKYAKILNRTKEEVASLIVDSYAKLNLDIDFDEDALLIFEDVLGTDPRCHQTSYFDIY